MLLPIKWLKEYVNIDEDSKLLADRLTLSGSHVESIISLERGIENVVVGKIVKLEKHENADKLFVTMVDIGREEIQIVTGAGNLKVGDYIPVALIGAKLPNGLEIQETDFRGVMSYGMLCSLKELGYSDNVIPKYQRDGIFILDKEYPLGEDISKILGLHDDIIELEITPNRPDCLSIIGMARETAATYNKKVQIPSIEISNEVDNIENYIETIEVDSELCNRYYVKVIQNVKIKESPLWLQTRLMEAGVRPINNMVDITNYVMLEYGQPLHAFDLDKLNSKKIVVRRAENGETIKTIDEEERTLKASDLVIANGKEPIAIAGVMGGMDTEVDENTKTILLESANFNSKSVRLTAKDLALRTEASSRFEKGIDPNLCETAANRVCQLIEEIGAGTVVKDHIDIYENIKHEKEIHLRPNRVNKLLGVDLSLEDMKNYLERLDLKVNIDEDNLDVFVPTFRLDLEEEVDLIEEIGRLYGFHNIETKPLVGVLTRGNKPYEKVIEDKANTILQGLGLNQVMTYSFISPKAYDKLNVDKDSELRNYIKILNPLGEDYSVMRTTLISNMLNLLGRNFNYGVEECFMYEIGNIFLPMELPIKELPIEKKVLNIGMYGDVDFYDIKEIVEILLSRIGINELEFTREENNPIFHPNRTANIMYKNEYIGIVGEIHMDIMEKFEIGKRVYMAELDFSKIIEMACLKKTYTPLPKYPSITRDIAVVVDKDIMVGELEKLIWDNSEGLIEDVKLFDIYEGEQLKFGKKSVAFTIRYRSFDRTLKDNEVNEIQKNIIEKLEKYLGAQLRS